MKTSFCEHQSNEHHQQSKICQLQVNKVVMLVPRNQPIEAEAIRRA